MICSLSGCATYLSAECEWYQPVDINQSALSLMTEVEQMQMDFNRMMFVEHCQ